MTRPAFVDISAAVEAWDAEMNDNMGLLRDGPAPVGKEYLNADALPSAAAFDRSLAWKQITTGLNPGWRPVWSDGTTWRYIPDNTQAYFDEGAVRVGAAPAASGGVRLSNASVVKARNQANSGDVSAIHVNASDQVELAEAGKDTVLAGGNSTTKGNVGASIDRQFTDVGNDANTTEKDLHTKQLAANFFNVNGRQIRYRYDGKTGATGNDKRIRVYFGSAVVVDSGVITNNNVRWTVIIEVFRTSSNNQRVRILYLLNGTIQSHGSLTTTQTDTGAITVKVTGQSPTTGAANDVVAEMSSVEYMG